MVDFIGIFYGDFLVGFFCTTAAVSKLDTGNASGNNLQPQHEKAPPGFVMNWIFFCPTKMATKRNFRV